MVGIGTVLLSGGEGDLGPVGRPGGEPLGAWAIREFGDPRSIDVHDVDVVVGIEPARAWLLAHERDLRSVRGPRGILDPDLIGDPSDPGAVGMHHEAM